MWYASVGEYYLAIRLMMYWYMLPYGQTLNILYSVKEARYEKDTCYLPSFILNAKKRQIHRLENKLVTVRG